MGDAPTYAAIPDGRIRARVLTGGKQPYQYRWSTGAFGAELSGVSAGKYEVTVTDAEGCSAVARYELKGDTLPSELDLRPFIPNAFSPNGDGQNDQWVVELPNWVSEAEVQIFDRWGSLLHNQISNESLVWDGLTSSGERLPEGLCIMLVRWRDVTGGTDQHKMGLMLAR